MTSNYLLDIEERLREHFRSLAASKQLLGRDTLSFALEHPLTENERRELGTQLSQQLARDRYLNPRYSLAWVVHATEQGYEFTGLQYWSTFAHQTPNWTEFGDPVQLRKQFKNFASEFAGVVPRGEWATNYSYICWPITNAIVPKDLQVRLAQSIYQARNQLFEFIDHSHESLGDLIREHSYYPSTRYAHFLEQTELVGQIVHALIKQDDDQALVRSGALARIVEDLSARTQAKEWLSDARSSYRRAKIRLRSSDRPDPSHDTSSEPDHNETPKSARLQSFQFTVRRCRDDRWKIWMAPPSFLAICGEHPSLRSTLEASRLLVECHGDRASPARSLLSASPREWTLNRWPADHEPLIVFDPPLSNMAGMLTPKLSFPQSTIWVFAMDGDDSAILCRRPVVHGGASFLIAAREATLISSLGIPIVIQCDDIAFVKVVIPHAVSADLRTQLNAIGIEVGRHLDISPAGLRPRRWSDNGDSEWLTSENILLAIEQHQGIAALGLAFNSDAEKIITLPDDNTVFLSLGHQDAGNHELRITGYSRSPSGAMKQEAHSTLHLLVRAPSPWVPQNATSEQLVVTVTPIDPSVDDLLSGRLVVSAEGIPGLYVRCRLILRGHTDELSIDRELFGSAIPFTGEIWSKHLESYLDEHANDREFIAVTEGCLEFESSHFGIHRVPLKARLQPLRWVLDGTGNGSALVLTNDGVGEDAIALAHYPFAEPMTERSVHLRQAFAGIAVANERGLFVALSPNSYQAVIAGPPQPESIHTLVETPDPPYWEQQIDVASLVDQYKLWSAARASNGLCRLRQRHVLREIRTHVHRLVLGADWLQLEERLPESASSKDWDRLERAVDPHGPISYAISLSRAWTQQFVGETLEHIYTRVTSAYKLPDEHNQGISIAWQMVNDLTLLPPKFMRDIASIDPKAFRTIVRGARLLHLLADRSGDAHQ